jgi:hypothetical protein
MTELEKVIERFERGYTSNLYGTVDLANFQKEYDFMELIQIAKKLTIPNVSQQRELLIAYNIDFYKNIHDVDINHIEKQVDKYLSNL